MNEFQALAVRVKEFLSADASGHDFHHAQRVFNNAMTLCDKEQQGDRYIIGGAVLVHDICRPWEKQTGKAHFCDEALEIIRGVLQDAAIKPEAIQPILEIVRLHDIYDWTIKTKKTIELQIVQDADNLDAIGAIGIGRTFAFGGAHGLTFYHTGENLDFTADFVEDPNQRTTTIAHFYETLLKLKDNMNTASGLAMAAKRHDFMDMFLAEFFAEWAGEK